MPPKILHLIETTEPGGAETVFAELASCRDDQFHSVGGVLASGWASQALGARGTSVHYFPLDRSFDIFWIGKLVSFIRREQIDLIHAHEFTMNCYASLAAQRAGVPIVCTVHGKNYYSDRLYRRAAYRWVARRAGAFVAVSADLKTFLMQRVGIAGEQISVVHNGIDTRRFKTSAEQRITSRRRLECDANAFVVLVVAALFAVKGHDELLRAMPSLIHRRPDTLLLLAGEGPMEPTLRSLARELGIEQHVRFLGFRSDVPDLLAAADAFVLPSHSEGLPICIIEAMAADVPVIATAVGGVPEIIRDEENGLLVPDRSPDRLACAILRVATEPDLAPQLCRLAQRTVSNEFSFTRMVDAYHGIYRGLLNS